MCGRFSFFTPREEWKEFTKQSLGRPVVAPESRQPRYNIAPGQKVQVYEPQIDEGYLTEMEWGFRPVYADDRNDYLINARAEKVSSSSTWKKAFKNNRCLIPTSGFYEWTEDDGVNRPYIFTRPEREPYFMAGLYRNWTPDHSQTTLSGGTRGGSITGIAVITTQPDDLVERYHDRMPVIVSGDQTTDYLRDLDSALGCLESEGSVELDANPVSLDLNDPSNDSSSVLEA
ncbi:MAG: SOS response-associated peptidase [Halobacteria archaeon]